MKKSLTISVAMAVYNGEKYLKEQIDSIEKQLREKDELVISLDPSSDQSEAIIKDYCRRDSRIRYIKGSGTGLRDNFQNAISHCRNDIVFLADQDDVWHENKVEQVLHCFTDPEVSVVMHDAVVVDAELQMIEPSFFEMKNSRTGALNNFVKNSYIGCCMAFRKELTKYILPFPKHLPMHDQWIGIIGDLTGKNYLLKMPLISYRRHGNNVSGDTHASVVQMISWRLQLLCALIRFGLRRCKKKNG